MKNIPSLILLGLLGLSVIFTACQEDDPNPGNGNGNQGDGPLAAYQQGNKTVLPNSITEDMTLYSDSVYYLNGYVFVEGGTITIEPGTVIMGLQEPETDHNASAFIVTRDAQINAEGTADSPIIFTSEADSAALGGEVNLGPQDTKLWAGVIILGKAGLGDQSDQVQIEGIPEGEDRALYGGNEDSHSSGTFKYVSIRFTGAEIGPGDEIQGLTLGGVGSGTTLEYVDIFASSDDGIEIFGGNVNIKYISAAFAEDDAFDFDTGWQGYGQFLFALQRANDADHGGEWDGAKPDDNERYTNARIYNATIIGRGLEEATEDESGSPSVIMRDGNAISLFNSIVGDFKRKAVEIEDRGEEMDSYDKLINQEVNMIANNIFFNLVEDNFDDLIVPTSPGDEDTFEPRDPDGSAVAEHLKNNNNVVEDPMLGGISRESGSQGLDPRPSADIATSGLYDVSTVQGGEAENVNYKGAFDPEGDLWISGWSSLDKFGILK